MWSPPRAERRVVGPKPSSDRPQLRRDPNAALVSDHKLLGAIKRFYFLGTGCPPVLMDAAFLETARSQQRVTPVQMATSGQRRRWWFEDQFWWENAGYGAQDVLALIRQRQRQDGERLERARRAASLERRLGDIHSATNATLWTQDRRCQYAES